MSYNVAVCAVWLLQDNLKKTIAYTLAHAVPEVWPLFLALVLNFPLGECCLCVSGEGRGDSRFSILKAPAMPQHPSSVAC